MSASIVHALPGATWGQANVRFFRNYALFSGRASLSEYWWWALTNIVVTTGINVLGGLAADDWRGIPLALPLGSGPTEPATTLPGLIAVVWTLVTLIPNLALTWRRLHDTDRSGGWFLLVFLPVIGWIVLFFFLLGESRPEGSRAAA